MIPVSQLRYIKRQFLKNDLKIKTLVSKLAPLLSAIELFKKMKWLFLTLVVKTDHVSQHEGLISIDY